MIGRHRSLLGLFLLGVFACFLLLGVGVPQRGEQPKDTPAAARIPSPPRPTQVIKYDVGHLHGVSTVPPLPVKETTDPFQRFRRVEPAGRIAGRPIAPDVTGPPTFSPSAALPTNSIPALALPDNVSPAAAEENVQQEENVREEVVRLPDGAVPEQAFAPSQPPPSPPQLQQPDIVQRLPQIAQPDMAQQPGWAEQPPMIARIPSPIAPFPEREIPPPSDAARPHLELPPGEQPMPLAKTAATTSGPLPRWQEPKALLECLGALKSHGAVGQWSAEVTRLVGELGVAITKGSGQSGAILQRLEQLAEQSGTLAGTLDDRALARRVGQAGHALRRRLDIWKALAAAGGLAATEAELPQADFARLSLCLNEINALTAGSSEGQAWREYLLVDALEQCTQRRQSGEDAFPRDLAQAALKRLAQSPLSPEQRQFVSREPMVALEEQLHRLAAEPVDRATLLAHLEQYEQTRLPADAEVLARDCQSLAVSPNQQSRELARRLETHYRNANVRLAISEQLLNRLMPEQNLEYSPVRDTVLGVPVRGESLTSSEVAVRMLPDPNRVRLALEITGEVASLTSSSSGPAKFVNRSSSTYVARKPLELDLRGIHPEPAEVQVNNETYLRNLETDFDGIPLIGALAKGIARSQHEQSRPAANREIKRKIAWTARQRIDTEAGQRLGKVSQRLHERVLEPLYALSLDPTLINAETSPQRFVMRLRLAGEDQLGSHTPRPQALADSLASFQVHETVLNNMLARLELDGKTLTLPQLGQHVAARFGRGEAWEINPDHDDVAVTFADRNAIHMRCQDNQVVLTLAVARLSKPPRSWKNFQVRAFYRPEVNGRSAELSRDGVIHLIGQRDPVSQIVLRGIFARTFPRKTPFSLTPERLATDPALADLAISQFTIDDGWIGVALSTKRTVSLRPGLLRR